MSTGVLLSAKELSVRFGGVLAVNKVSFDVHRGEVFTLIGPNGAGKTTVFNLISRIYTPTSGAIEYDGTPLLARAPHEIAPLGCLEALTVAAGDVADSRDHVDPVDAGAVECLPANAFRLSPHVYTIHRQRHFLESNHGQERPDSGASKQHGRDKRECRDKYGGFGTAKTARFD